MRFVHASIGLGRQGELDSAAAAQDAQLLNRRGPRHQEAREHGRKRRRRLSASSASGSDGSPSSEGSSESSQ